MDRLQVVRGVHRRLTSGDLSGYASVDTQADRAVDTLISAGDLISVARTTPVWDGGLSPRFWSLVSWGAATLCERTQRRLNRYMLAVALVEGTQRAHAEYIEELLHRAERLALILDAVGEETPGPAFLGPVYAEWALRAEVRLVADLSQARQLLEAETYTQKQLDWLADGQTDSLERLRDHDQGPQIPDIFGNGTGDPWVPQGLTYDPETGYLFQTSYAGDRSILSVVDPRSGKVITTVELGTGPDHAGGVSVHNGTVWVSSSHKSDPTVVPYKLKDLLNSPPYMTVAPSGDRVPVDGGAYHTVVGDTMYAGTFSEDGNGTMSVYAWDDVTGTWRKKSGPHTVPPQTQGVAVQGDKIVFSTSWGRGNSSTLQSYALADILATVKGSGLPDPEHKVTMPNMAEGIAIGPGGLYTTYESGALGYHEPSFGQDAEDLWASTHMTITPFTMLGLQGIGELEVEIPTLRQAAKKLMRAEDKLETLDRRMDDLRVRGSDLPDVQGAHKTASDLNRHARESADWVRAARFLAEKCAGAAVASADAYERAEDNISQGFARGERRIARVPGVPQ